MQKHENKMRCCVHKYLLVPHGADVPRTVSIEIPRFAEFLYVGTQPSRHNQEAGIYVWVRVWSDNELYRYTVYCVGTGHNVPEYAEYIGTVQSLQFVYHAFLKPPPEL